MKRLATFISSTFLLLACTITANAQLTIAPTNIYVDDATRFATYLVINGSPETQEVSIDFVFGYSDYEASGDRTVIYDDAEKEGIHSAAGWVRAFPKNFTLAPGQRQVVRLRISSPQDITDGTYWARVKTSSTPQTAPVELSNSDAITARVGFVIEQVTGLYFKKGDVSTGIDISEIRAEKDQDGFLRVYADVKRTGNSPFLGSITTNIYKDGEIIRNSFISTTVFFDGTITSDFDANDLSPGNYEVEFIFESQRNDISDSDIVKMETVSKRVSTTIR